MSCRSPTASSAPISPKRRRPVVFAMHHGADVESTLNGFLNGSAAGVSGRAGDQQFAAQDCAP